MENIWEQTKTAIKGLIPTHKYQLWIEPMNFEEDNGGGIIFSCPNSVVKKRVENNYLSIIKMELDKISGKKRNVLLDVRDPSNIPRRKKPEKKAAPKFQLSLPDINMPKPKDRLFRTDFTFDQFIVGDNNDFAYSAAMSLAEKGAGQNSLFLLSETGMGKSHLSQAIGHHILSKNPLNRVCYITAEEFMNEMIHAFQNNSVDQFKKKFRNQCDVLLLEDVHFLTGKERTQVELALALDHLLDADKKIIFTSCYLPSDIPKLNEQLKSRFSGGLISGIEPPDFRTRVKILHRKVRENGFKVPRTITEYLASELFENVRQLESGLIGVAAKGSLMGRPIDLGLAESVVKNIVQQSKSVTIDVIKELVCKHYNITLKDMLSRSRRKAVVWPRQMAIFFSRKYTDQPLQLIGKSFNRYHATVLHSIAAVEKGLKVDPAVRKQVEYLSEKLESRKFAGSEMKVK